ncbi:hypothetical protein ACIBSV_23570 [Embleya sp. NPDC050154]|uniref:hypothetical protein n=1 Tax=Embleya sp. NPDC050154 TaxID=3363988 RepID=UPI0037BCCD31
MRISEFFQLGRRQPALDFVDVDTLNDVAVYIDPSTIHRLPDQWGEECDRMLTTFFDSVLDSVKTKDSARTRYLLGNLREPNETHLGISKGKSAGRGMGTEMGTRFAAKLAESRAAHTGLIEDLEDTAFFIEKVGQDIISDITTNIIRGPLIAYTHQMCKFFDISMEEVWSGPTWNTITREWEDGYVDLPMTEGGKLLLVPKVIVRRAPHLSRDEYFAHHLAPVLEGEELANPKSRLVKTLKDGQRRVFTKDLAAHYGTTKPDITNMSLQRPTVFRHYKDVKKSVPPRPLTHEDLSAVVGGGLPEYQNLLKAVVSTPRGRDAAHLYHHRVEALLSALLYPSLCMPEMEEEIHDGRKRIDISYTNNAASGFFDWLTRHKIVARYVYVECKNYGGELKNPELDQISSRFSPLRGNVGLLVCRSFQDKDRFLRRCRDTALDHRGYVLTLDDDDLRRLVDDVEEAQREPEELEAKPASRLNRDDYPLLRERFKALTG